MTKQRILTKNFALDSAVTLCCSLNYFTLLINMVGFSIVTFGASTAEAGLAAGLYVIGGLVSRLFFGKYVDLYGRKKVLVVSLFAALIMSALYFAATSLLILYVIRFLHGITYGLISTATGAIMAKILPPSRRGEGLGYYYLSITFATAIGPFLGMVFGKSGNYDMVFSVGLVMYTLALIFSLFLKVPEETLTESQVKEARSFRFDSIIQRTALPLAFSTMVFYLAYSSVLSYISSYAAEIDMVEAATYFYLAVSAGTVISRFTTGKIYDARGPNIILIPAYIMFVAGMMMFANISSAAMMYLSGFIIGYAMSIVFAVCQAVVIAKSPSHRYGVTTSTFAAFTDLGTGMGPSILGFIVAAMGYSEMYMICAFIGVISFFMYWLAHGHRHGWSPE